MKPRFEKILTELQTKIGSRFVYTDEERLAAYNFDGTDLRFWPDIVMEPETTEQVSLLMKLATKYKIPVIPRGAGTGVTGGALAVSGGILLSLLRMNKILSIDEINMTAVVEPGVINQELHRAAKEKGLYYPPDPASYETSSIGGNIAEDAGGPHCYKYGTTRDYVLGLEIVLPDGTIMNTGVQTRKGVVGYDLTNLIIGSEGTLAIVTKAILRLIPLPAQTITLLAFFPDIHTLSRTLYDLTQKRIVPSALEFLDPACVEVLRDNIHISIPGAASTLLIIDLDGEESELEKQTEITGEACFENRALDVLLADSSEKREGLWAVRRKFRDLIKERSQFKISEDVTVPIRQIPKLIAGARQIATKYDFKNYNYGHLGDGNVHVNFTHQKKSENIVQRSESAVRELFELTVRLGGTISGEHGIGITKMNFLHIELSEKSIELQKKIKQVFDPLNILNPNKIFPKK
ncbi:MAG: FAD-binding protein [Calditrichaeota bacterium]|nr:FAD-binding protein [Calditrichota bacterium]